MYTSKLWQLSSAPIHSFIHSIQQTFTDPPAVSSVVLDAQYPKMNESWSLP